MKATALLLALILLSSATAVAAQIYGSLRDGNRAVSREVPVIISCGSNQYRGQTDDDGAYRIYVPETGRCTLQVNYGGQQPSIQVYSFSDPTKYDFDLVRQADGTYGLTRR